MTSPLRIDRLLYHLMAAILLSGSGWCQSSIAPAPAIEILDTRVISWKPPLYHGWSTLARRKDGELLLAFSGGREAHVCPFGRLEFMRSKDNGATWGWPQVLLDSPIDDRDAGVVETAAGSILVTHFTSLAFEPILERAERTPVGQPGGFAEQKLIDEWRAARDRLSPEERKSELGCYLIRSTDGGVTWSVPHTIGVWGIPSHLLRLQDGRLLMSYGYRRPPFGNQARVSVDNGATWSEPIVLSADGVTGDLGYPSTVECDDGALVTVWYEVLSGSPLAQLRQSRWRFVASDPEK